MACGICGLEAAATFSLSFQLTIDRLLFTFAEPWLLKFYVAAKDPANRRTATEF